MGKISDRTFDVIEYFLAFVWALAAVSAILTDPFAGQGPIAAVVGNQAALYFWATLFASIAVTLVFAKIKKKKRLHKYVLLASYLLATFTFILELLLFGGLTIEAVDSIVFMVVSGALWLRWKFKTEYIDPAAFRKYTNGMRDDLPPPS